MAKKKTVLEELLYLLNDISSYSWKVGAIVSLVFYILSGLSLNMILSSSLYINEAISLAALLPFVYAIPAVFFLLGLYFSIKSIKAYFYKQSSHF